MYCYQAKIIVGILSVCLSLTLPYELCAQDAKRIDSLKARLKGKPITHSNFATLLLIADAFKDLNVKGNLDSSACYGFFADSISDVIEYEKGKALSLLNLGVTFRQKGLFDSSNFYLKKSLDKVRGSSMYPEVEARVLMRLADNLIDSDKEKALEYLLKANDMMDSLGIQNSETAYLYRLIGDVHYQKGDLPQAINYLLNGVSVNMKIGDQKGLLRCFLTLGLINSALDDTVKAISYLDSALVLGQQINDPSGMASASYRLGIVYAGLEQKGALEKSEDYFKMAFAIHEKRKNERNMASALVALSIVNNYMQRFEKSDQYLDQALTIYLKLKNYRRLANLYHNKASNEFEKREFKEMKQSIRLFNQYADSANLPFHTLMKAKELEVDMHVLEGRKDLAYDALLELKSLEDSVFNQDKAREIGRLESQFELDKVSYENDLKDQQLKLQEAEITQQSTQRNALLVGLGLLGVISLLIYRSQQIKVRTNRQLRETEELKTRWFVNVSHELKTPLTLVQGPLKNLMEEENMNEFQKKDLLMANRNLEQLNGLVNEILDLSKLEEGKLELETNNTNMSTLLKTVTASFESLAKSNRVKLEAEVTEVLWMEVDRGKLRKLIENLISNALKFTHEEGEIITRLERKNEAVCLSVEDTGEGISEEDLAHVFERFYQSANKKKSRQGGTGIGLSLSSEVAQLHGGKLTVKSVEGEGSTFTLSLPLALIRDAKVKQDDPVIEEAEKEALYVSRLKEKPNLLLVEDNVDMQTYLESILKKYYRVRIARDGKEGVKKLREEMPDLIISDVMMPRMDGIELMKEVKSHKEWSHLPFIALTALNSDEERLQALRTGIDDYLAKPFNAEELLVRASNLLQNRDNREDDSEPSEEAFDDKLLRELEETVKEYISDHRLSVSLLAERGAMSESSLRRFLKKSTGLSPLDFIQEIKLQRAMQLLENRVYRTVKEVAAAVGFDRPSRFSAVFEKRFGKRPTDYIT